MKNQTNTPINKSNVEHLHPFIQISSSKRLLTLVTSLHLLAILSFLSAGIGFVWTQIPIFLLCIHLGVYWHCWRCSPVYSLRCLNQQWCLLPILKNSDASKVAAQNNKRLSIIACYYWSRFLVILIAKDDKGREHYIPIAPDCSKHFRLIKMISKTMLNLPVRKAAGASKT